jgi:hypothetical protein
MQLYFGNLETKEYLFLMKRLRDQDTFYVRRKTEKDGFTQALIGDKMVVYSGVENADRLKFRILVKMKGDNL